VIIARTPVRVSLLGGGTDYPSHFREHGGQTLSLAIDHYSYVTVKRLAPLFDYSVRVSYSRMETVQRVDEIEHPSVRECLKFLGIDGGVEIHYVGDLPARSGLGSSSSFTVCLLHALHAFKGDEVGPRQLAEEAVIVEQQRIRERVGLQDQYISAFGGVQHFTYARDGSVGVSPLVLSDARQRDLLSHLMLFYTRVQRRAHEVLDEQLEKTRRGELKAPLGRLSALVDEGIDVLRGSGPITRLGDLLDEAWQLKRTLSSKIANPAIDDCYARARSAGAVGGKLLGAGSGGFMLFLVEPARQAAVAEALPDLGRVDFGIDAAGSAIVFAAPP
jgi:D-glycero-alpha-D-manno-heptose-7-phosphate kinase